MDNFRALASQGTQFIVRNSPIAHKQLRRILYVEDQAELRELVGMALVSLGGFEVDLCESGAMALNLAPSCKPDLILLDMMMPYMDGQQTLSALRRMPETTDIPVIFITAKAGQKDVQRYRELDVLDIIIKPFDIVTLAEDIQQIWSTCYE